MRIYVAGGPSITQIRHRDIFESGCRNRLVSFFDGPKKIEKVLKAAKDWQDEKTKADSDSNK